MQRLSDRRFQLKPTLSILWKDAHTRGVKGVVELRESDLLWENARVGDLFPILNKRINAKYQADRNFREVESFLLYGTRVSPDRRLDPLIPELGLAPRFVAVMRVYPKKVPRTKISVFIKTLTNQNLLLHCESSDTVGAVKIQIQGHVNTARDFQCLIYDGKELEDHLALSTYGITDRSQIRLVRMMNGGGAPRIFADISDNSLLNEYEFSRNAPEWRMASQGLNIEGRCKTPECAAFRKMIICPRGFHNFNLIQDEDIKCPMCQSKVTPRTCVFYDCAWKFDGVQAVDGYSIISQWKEARGYKYQRFDADKFHGPVRWESLLIVAKPLDESVTVALSSSGSMDSAEPCPICWSSLGSSEGGFAITTTCGHSFHCKCVDEWSGWCTRYGNLVSCPLCRGELEAQAA